MSMDISTDEVDAAPNSYVDRLLRLEKAVVGNKPPESRSLQERIASLEATVATIKGTNQTKDNKKITEETTPGLLIPEVRRVFWSDFKNRWCAGDGRYAIEALYVGTDFGEEIRKEHQRRRLPTDSQPSTGPSKPLTDREIGRRWMYRIRIQSRSVLTILSHHLRQDWNEEIRVFVRPFRPLIAFHDKMKESLAELERKYDKQHHSEHENEGRKVKDGNADDNTNINQSNINGPMRGAVHSDEKQAAQGLDDIPSAVAEMRCYVDFMDNEVMQIKNRLSKFSIEDPPKVRWDDLWCLFERGQYIFTPADSKQKTGNVRMQGQARAPGWQTVRKLMTAVGPDMRLKTPGWHRKERKRKGASRDGTTRKDNDETSDDDDDDYADECFICDGDPEPSKGEYALDLWCYHIDFDGTSYRPVWENISIDYYHGEREIESLIAYPLKLRSDKTDLLRELRLRGESFKTFIQAPRSYYSGRSLDKSDARHYEGEVIIDVEEALLRTAGWEPNWLVTDFRRLDYPTTRDDFAIRQWSNNGGARLFTEVTEIIQKDYGIEFLAFNDNLKEEEFLVAYREWVKPGSAKKPGPEVVDPVLLPQRLLGYVLRERKFCQLDVHRLRPLKMDSDGLEALRIDHESKRLIKSLVYSHFERKRTGKTDETQQMTQDIIAGKANNLIILLHGVPGVGKTATAEAVAQANDKPLLQITCGDLGTNADKVEERLSAIFQFANKWNCVLLLDEADVFLAARRTEDLERNAIVSVFLRILEYYTGILILTTNRVGTLDEAFQSRIHTMIYYPQLGFQQTIDIFAVNIDQLSRIEEHRSNNSGRPAIEIDREDIMSFATEHFRGNPGERWNGRQIRNAFQIASSQAIHDWLRENPSNKSEVPPTLKGHHFERVATSTSNFHRYLREARGKHAWELAQEHNERADDFGLQDRYPDSYRPRELHYNRSAQLRYNSSGRYNNERHQPTPRPYRENDYDGYSDRYNSSQGRADMTNRSSRDGKPQKSGDLKPRRYPEHSLDGRRPSSGSDNERYGRYREEN